LAAGAKRRQQLFPFHFQTAMSASPAGQSDRTAAYTGLAVGAVAVFVILFGVVKLTNAKFAAGHGGEHGEKPAAEAAR
jgi:hypothetical protein